MTSIKKYIDEYERSIARSALNAYCSALACVGRNTEWDNRNSTRFGELTVRLQSIGRLQDISAIRRQLAASALDLKTNVQRMDEEGQTTVSRLQTQIEAYRTKVAESERSASTDPFTGLENRRGIELALESRQKRESVFSLILLDLNGLKDISDTHGHLVGDDVLKHFAGELREQFRSSDVVGRWGGDEFVVITDSSPGEIDSYINRIRRWVPGKYRVKTPAGTLEINLDAAIGIAAWDLREDPERVFARADALMYAEKRLVLKDWGVPVPGVARKAITGRIIADIGIRRLQSRK